jgi:hypothetical protein
MGGEFIGEDGDLAGWTVDDVKDAARHLRATPFEPWLATSTQLG